jgi:hypothetical protein
MENKLLEQHAKEIRNLDKTVTTLNVKVDMLTSKVADDNNKMFSLLKESIDKKDALISKIILYSVGILGTVTLAAFGITKIIGVM